jgi:hypothetical protein
MHLSHLGFPKLRDVIAFLERYGFRRGELVRGTHVLYRHPEVPCDIALRDGDLDAAVRPIEMMSVYMELTDFGVATERQVALFWAKSVLGLPFDE